MYLYFRGTQGVVEKSSSSSRTKIIKNEAGEN
jgi:hypothetical protein